MKHLALPIVILLAACGRSGYEARFSNGDAPDASDQLTSDASDQGDHDPGDGDGDESAPTCGRVGFPCCAGSVCDSGACFGDTCATWAGAFSCAELNASATCSANSLTGDIGCPGTFTSTAFEIYREQSATTVNSVSICADPSAAGSFLGMFTTGGIPCQSTSGICACPPGATAAVFGCPPGVTWSADTLTVCSGAALNEDTFFGTYGQGAASCAHANPATGACACPAGTTGYPLADLECVSVFYCARVP